MFDAFTPWRSVNDGVSNELTTAGALVRWHGVLDIIHTRLFASLGQWISLLEEDAAESVCLIECVCVCRVSVSDSEREEFAGASCRAYFRSVSHFLLLEVHDDVSNELTTAGALVHWRGVP